MATNDKWEPPPYKGGKRTTRETQASETIAADSCVESQAQFALKSYDYNAHPEHGYSSSTPNAKAKNALDNLQDSNYEDVPCDLRIVLVGSTGTGKSATGNTLIGGEKKVFETKASRLSVTRKCSVAETERFGKKLKLVVVDTPGMLATTMTEEELKIQLMECTYLACPGVHAFLFLMKIGQRDIANEDTKAFHIIKYMLREDFLSHTIVVFTGKETLDEDGDDLESYLSKLPDKSKAFIKLCKGGVVAVSNIGGEAEKKTTAKLIVDKVEKLVEQNGGRSNFYKNALFDEKNKVINKRMEQILNENHKIQNMINVFDEKMESLKRDIKDGKPTKEQNKEQQTLQKQIDDLRKGLVDRTNLRLVATDKINKINKIKYERRKEILESAAKVAGLAICAGVMAAGPKTVIAGVFAAVTRWSK